jgi:hypothetical protein
MKYWKLYIGLYIFVLVLGGLGNIGEIESQDEFDLLAFLFLWGALFPLIGLIRQKAFLSVWVWKLLFIFQCLFIMGLPVAGILAVATTETNWSFALALIVIAMLLLPTAVASYLYSFKSNAIWREAI